MKTVIFSNNVVFADKVELAYITFEDGVIISVTSERPTDSEVTDYGNSYVCPGFIDLHTHGGNGFPFVNCTPDDVVNGSEFHLSHGTTSICPTVSASPYEVMKDAVIAIGEAKRSGKCKADILGAHLEGPYLSVQQCGAQCTDFITEPIEEHYKELVENYGSDIARWTYAPERDEGAKFCKYMSEHGIVTSAGHTNAVYDDMKTALENGCALVTHLFSCTSTITRHGGFRKLGVIESAFLEDGITAEIIADGKHLPPELIKLIYKVKGSDGIILCTDSLALAGTDTTHGFMLETEYIIEDGVCKLMDRSAFAGSIATSDRLIRVMVTEAGVPVCETVKMLTLNPAKIMGLTDRGEIAVGKRADIAVLDEGFNATAVYVKGKAI